MIPTRTFQYAFGFNKQASIGAAIASAKLAFMLPMEGFGAVDKQFPDIVSDRNRFGKGHDFATFYERIDNKLVLPQRSFSLSPHSAIWIPSFVLGTVATTNPTAGVYVHTFTFADKFTIQQCRYTSLIENCADFKELLTGLVLESFTMDFNKTQHVMISTTGQARSRATSVIAMPALTAQACYFKALSATFKIGAAGGSVSVNSTLEGGQLTVTQAPEVKFMPTATAADVGLPTYFLIGQQGVTGNLRVLLDTTRRNLFLDATECELIITLLGTLISGIYFHTVEITIPHFIIATGVQAEEGQETAITLTFDENSVLKDASDDLISIAVTTDIVGTDILVNSP